MLALLLVVKVGSLSPVSSLTTQPEPPGQFSALQISASNTKSTSRRAIASGSLSPFSFLLDLGDKLLRSCFSLESNPSTNFGTSCHESLPGRALLTFKTPNRRPVFSGFLWDRSSQPTFRLSVSPPSSESNPGMLPTQIARRSTRDYRGLKKLPMLNPHFNY